LPVAGPERSTKAQLDSTMHILAIENEVIAPLAQKTKELLHAEAARVWDLRERGVIREIWFDANEHNAVIMLECADATEARQHLESLPLVQAGVIDFTVHELHAYDGFERLFSAGGPLDGSDEANDSPVTTHEAD
jgi:muconolactone delta-isomerase